MKSYVYFSLLLIVFGIGSYVWKIRHTGKRPSPTDAHSQYASFSGRGTLVNVGDVPVTIEDIDFEFQLQTLGLHQKEQLTAIPDLGAKLDKELSPLKQKIAGQIIERKTLVQFLSADKAFFASDPARFQACIKDWHESIPGAEKVLTDDILKERFKKILCERSLIEQYAHEVVFKRVSITEGEVLDYYKNHNKEFRQPERVVIRQIVLGNEADAVRLKGVLNKDNFAQMARAHSIAPEKEQGGLLGPFAKADMPQVFEIAFSMHPGEIHGILKSVYGFHFILLERKLPKSDWSLREATPKIREILTVRHREEEYQKWVEQALNSISITTPQPLW